MALSKVCLFALLFALNASAVYAKDLGDPEPFVLPDLNGNMVSSADFIGKTPTLLVFWASW